MTLFLAKLLFPHLSSLYSIAEQLYDSTLGSRFVGFCGTFVLVLWTESEAMQNTDPTFDLWIVKKRIRGRFHFTITVYSKIASGKSEFLNYKNKTKAYIYI